jgi:hypothetical protein
MHISRCAASNTAKHVMWVVSEEEGEEEDARRQRGIFTPALTLCCRTMPSQWERLISPQVTPAATTPCYLQPFTRYLLSNIKFPTSQPEKGASEHMYSDISLHSLACAELASCSQQQCSVVPESPGGCSREDRRQMRRPTTAANLAWPY